MNESQTLATGGDLIGGGVRSTGSAIREMIREAQRAYAFRPNTIPAYLRHGMHSRYA